MTTAGGDPNVISTCCFPQCACRCITIWTVTFLKPASAWFWSRTFLIMEAGGFKAQGILKNKPNKSPNQSELTLACHVRQIAPQWRSSSCNKLLFHENAWQVVSWGSFSYVIQGYLQGSVVPPGWTEVWDQVHASCWRFSLRPWYGDLPCVLCVCVFCDKQDWTLELPHNTTLEKILRASSFLVVVKHKICSIKK